MAAEVKVGEAETQGERSVEQLMDDLEHSEVTVSHAAAEALLARVEGEGEAVAVVDALVRKVQQRRGAGDGDDSVVQLRFADLIARICAISDALFEVCRERGAVDYVLRLATTPDVLTQMNAIELLERVGKTRTGILYLFNHDHVRWLLQLAGHRVSTVDGAKQQAEQEEEEAAEPDPLLGGSALRVLTTLLSNAAGTTGATRLMWSEIDRDLVHSFLQAAAAFAESSDESMRLAAMHAISAFAGASPTCLQIVLADSSLVEVWLDCHRLSVHLKSACLHSVAQAINPLPDPLEDDSLFQPPDAPLASDSERVSLTQHKAPLASAAPAGENESENDNDTGAVAMTVEPAVSTADAQLGVDAETAEAWAALKRQLFDAVGEIQPGGTTMQILMKHVEQPVPEMRYAAMNVLRAAASDTSGWGLRALFAFPDFGDYLKNRDTEFEKAGKEWKFSVIEAVMRCPQRHILGSEMLDDLRTMLRQGPFHKEAAPEVETMS